MADEYEMVPTKRHLLALTELMTLQGILFTYKQVSLKLFTLTGQSPHSSQMAQQKA